jgi:hypothetical protein
MFFIKRKELVVDAFCSEQFAHAYKSAPIEYAYKFYPKWWKDLEYTKFNFDEMAREATMKTCTGLIDHYKNGLIIPLWCDLAIKIDENDHWFYQFADKLSKINRHPSYQRGDFYKNYINLKIDSPWKLRTKEKINFVAIEPFWNNDNIKDIVFTCGTFNFNDQHTTHMQVMFEPKNQNIMIPFKQPMMHLIPMSEKKIVLKKHLISDKEYLDKFLNYTDTTFLGKYTKRRAYKKCPFGFS